MLRRFTNAITTTAPTATPTAVATSFAFLTHAVRFQQQQTAAAATAAAAFATATGSSKAASAATTTPSPAPPLSGGLRKVRVRAKTDDAAIKDLQQKLSADLDKSCSSTAPAEKRPLTALQRRQMAMKDKLVFSLTPNAVYRIKVLLEQHNRRLGKDAPPGSRAVGIRVGVQKRGCSGYSYTVNYALETDLAALRQRKADLEKKYEHSVVPIDTLDSHVEQNGVHVIVDAGALFYVIGTKVDYVVSAVEEKFEFANPNKKSSCGCGDSFMPDM